MDRIQMFTAQNAHNFKKVVFTTEKNSNYSVVAMYVMPLTAFISPVNVLVNFLNIIHTDV